jgi:acetyl esterase/lipase
MSQSPGRLLLCVVAWWCLAKSRAAEPLELPVWAGEPPGTPAKHEEEKWEERGKAGVINRAVRQVHRPTIGVYLPDKMRATGVAVLIAPGGGYEHVTIDLEGNDVARWLAEQGIAGIVLKYRLPKTPGEIYTTDTALADAREALKLVRSRAREWRIDPAKVGMMGFSAGGNLAALAGTKLPATARPAFLALMYTPIAADFGVIPADTPSAFIVQADNDPLGTEGSVRFYQGLRANKTPAELHLFADGGHGFGLGKAGSPAANWPRLFREWLVVTHMIEPTAIK